MQYTYAKGNNTGEITYDYVAVRYRHAVILFNLFGNGHPLVQGDRLIEAVLGRVKSSGRSRSP